MTNLTSQKKTKTTVHISPCDKFVDWELVFVLEQLTLPRLRGGDVGEKTVPVIIKHSKCSGYICLQILVISVYDFMTTGVITGLTEAVLHDGKCHPLSL